MTGEQNTQPLYNIEKDYLEMLLHKLDVMKLHGTAYYARKMKSDERMFTAAKADVNEYIRLLKKRGYSGDRFKGAVKSQELF